jgi:hypothetical protein
MVSFVVSAYSDTDYRLFPCSQNSFVFFSYRDHIFVGEDFCPGAFGEYVHVNSEFEDKIVNWDPMVACINFPYHPYMSDP